MKNQVLICCILLLIGCGKEDDQNFSCNLNPPNWLVGTWKTTNPQFDNITYIFKTDDIIKNFGSIEQEYCDYYKSEFEEEEGRFFGINLTDVIDDGTVYSMAIQTERQQGLKQTEHLTVTMISPTEIELCEKVFPCTTTVTFFKL